ncbi:MAG: adenylosuccinate synthetase [Candidatus Binataceae bacterium]
MPVTVIVGGQFGSEGKGKVAHALAREKGAKIAIRVGGSNSGHTVVNSDGQAVVLRQLPTAALLPGVLCVLGAGSYIDPDILLQEMERTGLRSDCLRIDPNAAVITDREKQEEASTTLRQSIGSTLSGTGAAVGRRIGRVRGLRLAKDEPRLQPFLTRVPELLRSYLKSGERLILEGTQGFGLSVLHSPDYPYVTSRDTTAAAFLSEAGLSPLDVDEVVLVIRAFPIRVAGKSGPLPKEVDWRTVALESGLREDFVEYTSVTRTVRRVGRFDPEVVRQAILVNRPTAVVLNHLDYVDASARERNAPSSRSSSFVAEVEQSISRRIGYFGFGPSSLVANLA